MTILSDREIRRSCVTPEYIKYAVQGMYMASAPENISAPYSDYEQVLIDIHLGKCMSSPKQHIVEAADTRDFKPMIEPFVDGQVRAIPSTPAGFDYAGNVNQEVHGRKIISYGASSYGYDVRVAPEFKIFTNVNSTVLDPKAFDERSFVDFSGDVCIIPPNSFVLARTEEYFHMPNDVTALVTSKSTYARLGINVLTTVIEAGWHGQIVLEFANTSPLPAKLYAGEGAAQLLFFKGNACDKPYDHTRKYQGQTGITLPKM